MKLKELKRAFWNPTTRTCLGRTSDSWLKLIAFYIVLYSCLAAIWSFYFYLFRLTINSKSPKWLLNDSLIGSTPGLGFRPRGIKMDSALITYKLGDVASFEPYVKNIDDYLKSPIKSTNPSPSDSSKGSDQQKTNQLKSDCNPNDVDSFCPFSNASIPPECSSVNNYSFQLGKPCVLLKLNRIYGWTPKPYKEQPANWPQGVTFTPNNIQITCEGQRQEDKDSLGPVKYFPETGIETKYYPFLNQPGYQPPYIMVHFEGPKQDTLINVECKAWAENVEHDRYNKKGLTNFELFIANASVAS